MFLLEVCCGTLSVSVSDMGTTHKSLPDACRIREMESLIGSLLVNELSLDKPDAFEFIYSLCLSSGIKPSSSGFRLNTFRKISSFLGRDSTGMEYLNAPIKLWKFSLPRLIPGVQGNFSSFLPVFIYSTWHWENLQASNTQSKFFSSRSFPNGRLCILQMHPPPRVRTCLPCNPSVNDLYRIRK